MSHSHKWRERQRAYAAGQLHEWKATPAKGLRPKHPHRLLRHPSTQPMAPMNWAQWVCSGSRENASRGGPFRPTAPAPPPPGAQSDLRDATTIHHPPRADQAHHKRQQQSTTMTFQSVTFGTDNRTVVSNDHDHLNRGVQNPSAMSDGQQAGINIATRNSGGLHTFNSGTGISEVTPQTTTVQLRVPDGKVQVGAYRTDAATAETLKAQTPEMFEAPEVKAARAAAEAAEAAAAAEADASMNTHPDSFIEESHTQFTDVVPAQLQTELLVQMHRDGVPSNDTLNRVADALGVTVDDAVTRLNAMSAGVQAQLSVLAKARGVNPEQFANWARDNRRGESLRAMQGHVQSRSLLSWDPLINEFKARGQR